MIVSPKDIGRLPPGERKLADPSTSNPQRRDWTRATA
jgi:hypothetical protein